MSTMRERGSKEATASPIFLLQTGRWVMYGLPTSFGLELDETYEHDGEGVCVHVNDERGYATPKDGCEYLSFEEMAQMETAEGFPACEREWDTARVFLSREEAESWGEAHAYRWRHGWRVYCVNMYGKLVEAVESIEWRPVAEHLPPVGRPVIVFVQNAHGVAGKTRRLRAQLTGKHTLPTECYEVSGWADEDEDGALWCPEGIWVESNEFEETHWQISGDVTHWQPLPEPPL